MNIKASMYGLIAIPIRALTFMVKGGRRVMRMWVNYDRVLLNAAMEKDFEKAKWAIANGAKADAYITWGRTRKMKHTILMMAAGAGTTKEILALLVDKGADVNARNIEGCTPLMFAENSGVVEFLVSRGADVNASDYQGNTTVLNHLCQIGNLDAVEFLIAKGADVNLNKGVTALIVAAAKGDKRMVELLLRNGADVRGANPKGATALDLAVRNGHKEIAEILRKELRGEPSDKAYL